MCRLQQKVTDDDDDGMFFNNLLEDVDINHIDVEMEDDMVSDHNVGVRRLNVGKLVHSCIQMAAAKVKDVELTQRSTDRVKILLQLLDQCKDDGTCLLILFSLWFKTKSIYFQHCFADKHCNFKHAHVLM